MNVRASSYYKSSVIERAKRAQYSPNSGLPPPSVCAEERSFKWIRARDCLSAASSSGTPLEASTAGCPQRSGGTQIVGSPFLLLTLLLAKQKKSESPAAATERHRILAKNAVIESRKRRRQAQPERAWGRERKRHSGSGVFGVRAQIPRAFGSPFGCCASLRSEIVIRPTTIRRYILI